MGLEGRDGKPISGSAIEGLVVGKAYLDIARCKKANRHDCSPTVFCAPDDAAKWHYFDAKSTSISINDDLAEKLSRLDTELHQERQGSSTAVLWDELRNIMTRDLRKAKQEEERRNKEERDREGER